MFCKLNFCAILLLLCFFAVGITSVQAEEGIASSSPPTSTAGLSDLPSNECDMSFSTSSNSPCPASAVIVNNTNAPIVAARSIAHSAALTPIDAYGYCRYVNNNSTDSIFLPFRTSPEWLAFIVNHPPGINLVDCSRGGLVFVPPNFGASAQTNQCASDPPSQPVTAPYRPYPPAATYTSAPLTFHCTSSSPSPAGTAFTETAVAQLTGIDSGYGPNPGVVGWDISDVLYTYNGMCGASNGAVASTAPTTDLRNIGAPSSPTQASDGSWNWACSGGNGGGAPATCSTGSVSPVAGVCGAVNGTMVSGIPAASSLCATGTATAVAGSGPWTWSCGGTGGETTASSAASAASCDGAIAVTQAIAFSCMGTRRQPLRVTPVTSVLSRPLTTLQLMVTPVTSILSGALRA
jgi:hypothetical protein